MLKIYYANIELVKDQLEFDKWYEKMDAQRQDKICCCQHEADKQRSLLAGVLLKMGKEKERFVEQFFYSISHSGSYVICVISNRRVGIDIENKFRSVFLDSSVERLDRIAKKCLTANEKIDYCLCEDNEKADIMMKFWTRKESYSKAVGKGLALDFSEIDTEEMDKKYWSGWLEKGYFCSLYVEDGNFSDMKLQEIGQL